jgi:signal transduction histidine kinase/DNA-binding response OmpR family regulator
MDSQGNVIKKYVMKEGADNDKQINSITNNYISQVSLSPDGKRLYVATSMGLCCLDIERENWINTFGVNCPNYGQPVRVAREYDGYIWVGTNEGLYCYDMKGKVLKQYDREQGLADNGVSTLERHPNGMLWIGTNHGLSCLNPRTGLFQNYFADDGLQGNEFGDGASYISDNGILIFGGTGGITWFKPEDIAQSKWEAVVRLTNFLVNGQPIEGTDRFRLSYHDNSFAVQFSTLTYENPEHISYLYSINGEPYIHMLPGTNEIVFSHMPPGTYRFRVKAERNNIETPEYAFTVVVASPWYRSSWAYFIYMLIIGAVLWQIILGRRRREQTRRRMQEHIHAEELGEAKLRFFMNISHEIRTPMTLIVTPLLSLIKNETDPHRKSVYETIRRNAERILSLINQMMDLRKIDKGQMMMRMTETNLVAFIADIHALFKHQAASKQVTLKYEHDIDNLSVWVDRKQFDKVIVNILSNAFKFTPTGGEIVIRLTHDDKQAHIAISDNGEQIPEEKLDKIFERFYQSASSVNDRNVGTGIGLDLTRSLVELHHGTIEAHNLKQGCEFVVTIPLGKAHLNPEELVLEAEAAKVDMEPTEMDSLMEELEEQVVEQPAASNSTVRLVIVEDDDEIRDYLQNELGQQYQVTACTNGKEALSEVLRSGADLVVSDVMMPEMDGNQLCAKLKMNPNTNFIPVILLTAKNRDEDKLEGLETGADAYIVKPFNMDILRRTIANLLNSHRLLRLKYERNDVLEEQVDEVKIKSPDEKLLDRVMATINAHLNDSDLSIDMIADEVGISRVHLHRKMKELTGLSTSEFVRNIRLEQAARLLREQKINITQVAYTVGYSSLPYFSSVFRKHFGQSPREFIDKSQSDT